MKINKAVLKLNAKPHNPFGIASLILVGIAFVLTVASVYVIAFQPQNRQNIILAGALEILGMTVTLAGIGVSVVGEEPDETEKIFVHIGLVLHIIGLIYHGIVVYQGFFV